MRHGIIDEFIVAIVSGFGISNDIDKVPEEQISRIGGWQRTLFRRILDLLESSMPCRWFASRSRQLEFLDN
jgi:hypothetical protein